MEAFSEEAIALFEKWKKLMYDLATFRRRGNELDYFKTWDKLLALKHQFRTGNEEDWD